MSGQRHRWGEPARFRHKTERTCTHGCGVTKVGHHQSEGARDRFWTEFWRDGERIAGAGEPTPLCEPFQASAV
jgi:hypothetical protein